MLALENMVFKPGQNVSPPFRFTQKHSSLFRSKQNTLQIKTEHSSDQYRSSLFRFTQNILHLLDQYRSSPFRSQQNILHPSDQYRSSLFRPQQNVLHCSYQNRTLFSVQTTTEHSHCSDQNRTLFTVQTTTEHSSLFTVQTCQECSILILTGESVLGWSDLLRKYSLLIWAVLFISKQNILHSSNQSVQYTTYLYGFDQQQ
jgi:hypothetical protein